MMNMNMNNILKKYLIVNNQIIMKQIIIIEEIKINMMNLIKWNKEKYC